jgi:hypothetical protein
VVKDANTINRKIQGKRAKKIIPTNPDAPLENSKNISVSQQSYDRLISSFSEMIDLLTSETNYTPNEPNLKIDSLNVKLDELKVANTNVINSFTIISNKRIERNSLFYTGHNALTEIAKQVKNYVKSVFGAASPQYKQISGIKINIIKN